MPSKRDMLYELTFESVLKVLKAIDEGKIRVPPGRTSRKYCLVYEGRHYPPKFVISKACLFQYGQELPFYAFSGGEETNRVLRRLGFSVVSCTCGGVGVRVPSSFVAGEVGEEEKREVRRRGSDEVLEELLRYKDEFIEKDKKRFETGDEWREFHGAMDILFNDRNSYGLDSDERLLAFWFCCILDRRVPVWKVWNNGVYEVAKFIKRGFTPPYPRVRLDESSYIGRTLGTLRKRKYGCSFSRWFIDKIRSLKPYGKGSLYRFVYGVFRELLGSPGFYDDYRLKDGRAGLLGAWKRLWMFVMFLRRDKSFVKQLLGEAVSSFSGGEEVFQIWYDESCFSSLECELPVDARIVNAFEKRFNFRGNKRDVAKIAHWFGKKAGVSPSVLDVMFLEIR
ncbi:MAG: hypothetical protein J7L07_06945 [Candidatus Odinarchaeota archaeon]|nr:hypothetical protein [Candidatus Odinarchaeota archaeon]